MNTTLTASRGKIGRRVITCLQTVDIGRLPADPVWLVPGGFIAVTGQGPIDSNESSKTTLEAALSLIHGDPGWRQDSSQFSSYAAELLFNPPNAPAGARVRADTGFIVAVFTDIAGDGSGRLPGTGDSVTVWIRLRRHEDPAFETALTSGVYLASGETNRERIQDAKRKWATLRCPKWGPQRYARELFGPGVSCLSYVSTRGGRSEQRSTLLGSDISQLRPEQIAGQLVDLAGMRQLFDNEAAQRIEFFRLSRALTAKEQEVAKASATLSGYAHEIEALDRRQSLLDQATAARERYIADTVLQVMADLAQLRSDRADATLLAEQARRDVAEANERLAGLNAAVVARKVSAAADALASARQAREPAARQHHQLQLDLAVIEHNLQEQAAAAAAWSGRPVDVVITEHAAADQEATAAGLHASHAAQQRDLAAAHLEAVRAGDAGPAGQRLADAGIPWQLLHDGVELADAVRPLFEPLLHPYLGAICVPPEHEERAAEALSGLPGTLLVCGDGPTPAGVLTAPAGAGGLLAWLAAEGSSHGNTARLNGRITVIGGFAQPTTGRAAREAAARAVWETAQEIWERAAADAATARDRLDALTDELRAAQAEQACAELEQQRDANRRQASSLTQLLTPLDEQWERADSAYRDAKAEQRDLQARQQEVTAHLKTLRQQSAGADKALTEIDTSAGRLLLHQWARHLDTCEPTGSPQLADEVGRHQPLDLPEELTAALAARVDEALARLPEGPSYREVFTRLEADLGIGVEITASRSQHTKATITGPQTSLDAVTRMALTQYHEQAAAGDRRRTRDSEEREIVALAEAITTLRTAIDRQAQGMQSAMTRAAAEYDRLKGEYENAYDDVHSHDNSLRNIQRGLEHQVRGLFTRISQRFNEIRYRDGANGGELVFEITPPSLDVPRHDESPGRGWTMTATPRWARRPPESGQAPNHVAYHEQANTAQYKLATVQLVLAALLANEDPIGRVLILDELGDGLGDAHRERVLDALHRAAKETGITVLATVQDDLQHEAFSRCDEVLALRYASDADLLNEPTYMFAGNRNNAADAALPPLIDELTSSRGPSWSALLTAYDTAAANAAAERRIQPDED